MRNPAVVLWLFLLVGGAAAVAQDSDAVTAQVAERLREAPTAHPRLFLDEAGWRQLRSRLAADELLAAARDRIVASADAILEVEPVRREQVGRRLLGVSRTCLKRVVYLGFAWRVLGERRYAARAAAEMRAAAGFSDWNPSHFLDVAEMTAALGIGYDWLHDALSPEDREAIRSALVELGLRPSMAGGWWVDTSNNWNQVCHGGLSLGALAVHEDEPELARRILSRAVRKLPIAMHEYAPDGGYPEGPSYWNYGTGYNAVTLAAFESVLGTDFGLAEAAPGFFDTPGYYQHVTGPTGLFFNYSDCGRAGGIAPAMFWFAQRLGQPGLLHRQAQLFSEYASSAEPTTGREQRFLPLALIWSPALHDLSPPAERLWYGQGTTPVALLRSAWTVDATWVGIKAGSPGANHAHMDAGSFVIDALGVRWASDLGSQSYHSLESKGIRLWDRGQDGARWTVFRLATAAHNVLMVDGEEQRVGGVARLERVVVDGSRPRALIDLAPVYAGQLAAARRGIELLDDGSVRIQDEFAALGGEGSADPVSVRWAMLTRADVDIIAPRRAVLRRDGEQVELQLEAPEALRWKVVDTSAPRAAFDHPNPGTRMMTFITGLAPGEGTTVRVLLKVGDGPTPAPRPLRDW